MLDEILTLLRRGRRRCSTGKCRIGIWKL